MESCNHIAGYVILDTNKTYTNVKHLILETNSKLLELRILFQIPMIEIKFQWLKSNTNGGKNFLEYNS